MKAFKDLDSTAKARLLHELFPDEIPGLLEYLKQECSDFEENKEQRRKIFKIDMFCFDWWVSLSQQTAEVLKKHSFTMLHSSRVFSDQLCYGTAVLFVNDCIVNYAKKVSANEKFRLMVVVLYH